MADTDNVAYHQVLETVIQVLSRYPQPVAVLEVAEAAPPPLYVYIPPVQYVMGLYSKVLSLGTDDTRIQDVFTNFVPQVLARANAYISGGLNAVADTGRAGPEADAEGRALGTELSSLATIFAPIFPPRDADNTGDEYTQICDMLKRIQELNFTR